jgi:hypothetical protein
MQLAFETWISDQPVPADAVELFREAVTCYRARADRAALLFSYLGFQTILRDRILASPPPAGFNPGRWVAVQRDTSSEGAWDSEVFKATQQKTPPIFVLTDDVRLQVAFWKDRRNDCAHGKRNKIDHSHVEAFWLFIESNIGRFVVNGSRTQLVERLRKHFDRTVTPAGMSTIEIARAIVGSVEEIEYTGFFEEAEEIFENLPVLPFDGTPPEETDFYHDVLTVDNNGLSSALISFLSTREEKLLDLLRKHPSNVRHLRGRDELVRKLWYKKLLQSGEIEVFCSMLTTNAIPTAQQDEAVSHAVRTYRGGVPAEPGLTVLKEHGFFKQLYEVAFVQGWIDEFSWGNPARHLVTYYLEHHDLDDTIVNSICSTFSKGNHPYELRDALNRFFRSHPNKVHQFHTILDNLSRPEPHHLSSLAKPDQE